MSTARQRDSGSEYQLNAFDQLDMTRIQARHYWLGNGWVAEYQESPFPVGITLTASDQCSIADQLGSKGAFNACSHTRRNLIRNGFKPSSFEPEIPASNLAMDWRTIGYRCNGSPRNYSVEGHCDASTWSPQFPAIDWDNLVSSAGDGVSGSLDAQMSILVSAAEYSQTLRMLKNPFGILKARWRRSDLSVRQLSKAGSNVWLEYRYGWKNFHRDLRAFSRMLEKVDSHLAYLKRTKDTWSDLCRSQSDDVECPVKYPTLGSASTGIAVTVSRIHAVRKATFSLEVMRGNLIGSLSRGDLIRQYTGSNNLMEALWDLVPFSFCVDWMVDVTRIIGTQLNPILWNQQRIRRLGHSVKTEFKADISVTTDMPLYLSPNYLHSWSATDQSVRKSYTRTPGFPGSSGIAGYLGNFSYTNIADSFALIAQRIT